MTTEKLQQEEDEEAKKQNSKQLNSGFQITLTSKKANKKTNTLSLQMCV